MSRMYYIKQSELPTRFIIGMEFLSLGTDVSPVTCPLQQRARGDGCINYLKATDGPLLVKIHLTLSSSYQDFNVI